jgi:hypothetical protein
MMFFLATFKTVLKFVMGSSMNPYFELFKISYLVYWMKESIKINSANFKLSKRVRLYEEVKEEVIKLSTIIEKAKNDG